MGVDDANSHAAVWLFGRTAGVQDNGFVQSDSNFMRLNRSKDPVEITFPQPSSPDTVPAGVERLYPRPVKRPSVGRGGISPETGSRTTGAIGTNRIRRSFVPESGEEECGYGSNGCSVYSAGDSRVCRTRVTTSRSSLHPRVHPVSTLCPLSRPVTSACSVSVHCWSRTRR